MSATRPKFHVPEFDGLRGLLAAWVCLTHLLCWCGYATFHAPQSVQHVWNDFVFAQPAVEVFIILSGFAISSLLALKEPTYGEFMRGRFFRLYPVYLVALALSLLTLACKPYILAHARWNDTVYFTWTQALSNSETTRFWPHLLSHLTLLHGAIPTAALPNSSGTILPPAWSISLEWQYYLIAPLLVLLLRSARGVLVVAAVVLVGSRFGPDWANPQLAFLPAQLPLFLLGNASYHGYRSCAATPALGRWIPRLAIAFVTAAALKHWHATAVTIWATAFVIITERRGSLRAWLEWPRDVLLSKPAQAIGRASYSLYLVHWPILIALLAGLLAVQPDTTQPAAVAFLVLVGLPVVAAATFLVHRFVEVPGMRLGKRSTVPASPTPTDWPLRYRTTDDARRTVGARE